MRTALSYRREAYRLWFEYLRVALVDPRHEVQEALKRSAPFYASWGDVRNAKFDAWWKEKGKLFEEPYIVRQLSAGDRPNDPDALILEIPLRQSQSVLLKRIGEIVQDELNKRTRLPTKSKKISTAQYRLTEGSEPKLKPLREALTVYRDVYLKHPRARGKVLLKEMRAVYLNRKHKRFAAIPDSLDDTRGKLENRMRNLRRYITNAEKIVLHVANGRFP